MLWVMAAEPKESSRGRGIVIDPTVVGVGGAVALLGVVILAIFLWMVPTAAARETTSACRGIGGYEPFDRHIQADGRNEPQFHGSQILCPGGQPCRLPVVAPDFTAIDHNGKPVKLSDLRGKVVLLNFWASWCNVCAAEKPSLAGMASDLASGDFVVLTIASDRSWTDVIGAILHSLRGGGTLASGPEGQMAPTEEAKRAYNQAFPDGLPFSIWLDPPQGDANIGPITKAWGITAVPETALIDRKGNIRAYFANKRDWETPVAQTCLRSVLDE